MKCAVANCNSTNSSKACEMSFFLFPTDASIQKQWLNFCGRREKINPKTSYVCMLHFNPGDIKNSLQYEMGFAKKRLLKRGAIPTVRPSSLGLTKMFEEEALKIKKLENNKMVNSCLQEYIQCNKNTEQTRENESDVNECGNVHPHIKKIKGENTQLNLNVDDFENLKVELQTIRNENKVLRRKNKLQRGRLRSVSKEMLTLKKLQRNEIEEMKKSNIYIIFLCTPLLANIQGKFRQEKA